MVRVIYDAGEKAVDPPMIGVREALRSDIDIRRRGFTAVDPDYDEHLENMLRPLTRDIKGFKIGPELVKDIREQMKDAFFLNKLNLPPTQGGKDMTAYEVGQRVQEYIRNALPLFEPMETDYNGQLCETDMQLILHNEPSHPAQHPGEPGQRQRRRVRVRVREPAARGGRQGQARPVQEAQQILSARSASTRRRPSSSTARRPRATCSTPWCRPTGCAARTRSTRWQGAAGREQRQQLLDMMAKGAGWRRTARRRRAMRPTRWQRGAGMTSAARPADFFKSGEGGGECAALPPTVQNP
jgi:hypothetical protein